MIGCAFAVVQRETLEQIAPKLPTLNEVVAADKKAGHLLHAPAWVHRRLGTPNSSHAAISLWPSMIKHLSPAWGMELCLAALPDPRRWLGSRSNAIHASAWCNSPAPPATCHVLCPASALALPLPCLHLQLPCPIRNAALQAGTVTVKNSPSRNLHRLLSSVSFIAALLQNLAADPKTSLHTAAASAYNNTMSPMHNFMVSTLLGTQCPKQYCQRPFLVNACITRLSHAREC